MKHRFSLLTVFALLICTAFAATTLTSVIDGFYKKYKIAGTGEAPVAAVARALHESPATNNTIQIYDDETKAFRDIGAADLPSYAGVTTVSLTSAAAATAVNIIPDSAVPAGKKVYVTNYLVNVGGATDWTTTTTVTIEDTAGVDFTVLTASTLDGNETHGPFSDSAALAAAMKSGTGGTAAKGLQVVGDQNGAGSTLAVTVMWVIK